MKTFKQHIVEKMSCPAATQNLKLNTKNRDATIKNYNYGPLNVDEPGDYWKDIAKYWKTTEEAAKKSVCNNCVAFDVSPRMLECLPGETSDKDGRLGYCWMHHFKCHSARACHTWAKGGPITTDKKSHDWQERAKMTESGHTQLAKTNIRQKRELERLKVQHDREDDRARSQDVARKNIQTEKAPNTSDAMKRYKSGKAGFTDIAHLKAKGLIKRSDGTKRKSDKYK